MYDKVTKATMVKIHFGCSIEDIADTVILTPIWRLEGFKAAADQIMTEFEGWYKGITLVSKGKKITVISSGIGAPMTGDCALALGYTDCSNVIFSGSAGAINQSYNIGDMLAVGEAVIGEGFSRYHGEDLRKDCFGELVQGDMETAEVLLGTLEDMKSSYGVNSSKGRIFSIDSILGERKETFDFMKEKGCDAVEMEVSVGERKETFDFMKEKGCDAVEMEVSAVFTACRAMGKKAAAMILISDLPLRDRNLFEGITESELKRYNEIRADLPVILLEAACRLR